jgi:hypothetical protein
MRQMPFRTKEMLDTWLDEFRGDGNEVPGRVALQDGSDGSDTGLVILRLAFAQTEAFVQPVALGDPRWAVTFEPRDHSAMLTPEQVDALGQEIQRISRLCSFLEAKSAEHLRTQS